MSAFKDMLIDIQESIERGIMTYQQIADMYGLPRADVESISKEMMNQFDDSAYDDYAEMEDE
jgi:alkylated DNA nucleotide flippase Atl1